MIEYLRSPLPCLFLFDGWKSTTVIGRNSTVKESLLLVRYSNLSAHQNGQGIRFSQYPDLDHQKIFEIWKRGSDDRWGNRPNLAHHYNDKYAPVYNDAWNSIQPNPECFRSIALDSLRESIEVLPF